MNDSIHYETGETIVFDYTDDREQVIWGKPFGFGDSIVVQLRQNVTLGDLHRNMGKGGPWGWGAFTTAWLESIAERIQQLDDDALLYHSRRAVHSVP